MGFQITFALLPYLKISTVLKTTYEKLIWISDHKKEDKKKKVKYHIYTQSKKKKTISQ